MRLSVPWGITLWLLGAMVVGVHVGGWCLAGLCLMALGGALLKEGS